MGERLAGASWPESELRDHRRRRGVSRVAVVSPDADSRTAIGPNVLDPASRAGSAKAGCAQAAAVAVRIAEVWTA